MGDVIYPKKFPRIEVKEHTLAERLPMPKFRQEIEGDDGWTDWIHPLGGYKISCCDCGLVHDLEFRLDDNHRLNFRARRNPRSTGQVRRHMTQKERSVEPE